MTQKIDQKAYLQKYLNGPSGDKKKKKKKHVKGKGLKIVDDDLDLTKLRPLDGDDLDLFDEGEDAPQIAGIIDERPDEVKKLEQFKTTSKWKVINQDDGFNSKLQIEEIKKDIKEVEKENELVFGKMYSDSEDEKKDSDASPPRKTDSTTKKVNKQNSDSDMSPPRRREEATSKKRKQYDSDQSPPRKSRDKGLTKHKSRDNNDTSPARNGIPVIRNNKNDPETRDSKSHTSNKNTRDRDHKSKNYNSDLSPSRRYENRKPDRPRKPSRWGDAEDSTQQRSRSNSPKNKRKSRKDARRSTSSDLSPPRKSQKVRNRSSDSDLSPPRKNKSRNVNNKDRMQKHRRELSDSDLSPPRKRQKSQSPRSKRKPDSDSDLSPPRKGHSKSDGRRRGSNSPPPSNKKMARTLEGKMAGLQDAKQLRHENEEFRKREEDVFKKMTDDVSGRNAKAVSRKSKRETSEDRQKQREKADRQKELDEKYKKWSRGVKQMEDQQARVEDFMHEAAKPLARLRGDKDLEARLMQEERRGDPMLKYIRDKKRERGELGPEKPSYKGQYPPNRFDIRPGYRWDGVDRSNGYEKKYFEQQSKRKAQEEEAYKWSTEDL